VFQPFRIRAALRRLAPFCSKNFSDHRKGREKFTHRTRARGNVSTGLVIVAKEETGESLSCGSGSPGDQRPFSMPVIAGADTGSNPVRVGLKAASQNFRRFMPFRLNLPRPRMI